MKKEYVKPKAEIVSLKSENTVAADPKSALQVAYKALNVAGNNIIDY